MLSQVKLKEQFKDLFNIGYDYEYFSMYCCIQMNKKDDFLNRIFHKLPFYYKNNNSKYLYFSYIL